MPWNTRRYYKQYENVEVSEKFVPLLGELQRINEDKKERKGAFYNIIEQSQKGTLPDFKLMEFGPQSQLYFSSLRAMDEFEKLVGTKVDRENHFGKGAWYLFPRSFAFRISDSNFLKRKKQVVRLLELNHCSQYLQMIHRVFEEHIDKIDTSKEVDLLTLIKSITIEVIINIMFGENCDKVIRKSTYIDYKTGTKTLLSFKDMYIKSTEHAFACYLDTKGRLFPFLAQNWLIEPFKSMRKNSQELYNSIAESLDNINDENSVIYRMSHNSEITKDEAIMDVLLLIFAGNDTSSNLLNNSLLWLYKNPEKLEKLKSELEKSGYNEIDKLPQSKAKDVIMSCDYLSYVIKETLRMDPPGPFSLAYIATDNFSVCGVDVKKDTVCGIISIYAHYDPEQYHQPLEFIPERYDSESKYFTKPIDGKARHPKSNVGFTFGQRACTGQVLAKFESRVLLAKLVTRLDIKHSEIDLKNHRKLGCVLDDPCEKCTIIIK